MKDDLGHVVLHVPTVFRIPSLFTAQPIPPPAREIPSAAKEWQMEMVPAESFISKVEQQEPCFFFESFANFLKCFVFLYSRFNSSSFQRGRPFQHSFKSLVQEENRAAVLAKGGLFKDLSNPIPH